jgi:beta-lactamase regulating signal transducer with metallopeptidase domain
MIAIWMLAATALGLLSGIAAIALERALRLMERQGRGVWVLALAVTCFWPVVAPALRSPLEQTASVRAIPGVGSALAGLDVTIAESPSLRTRLARLDTPLIALWAIVSALLLLRALVAVFALRRLAHRAEQRTVDGRSVLISPSVGPAAFGIVRPRIVLPAWSLELDTSMRELVLRHELEHVSAADPTVLTLAWLLTALMPWNVGLWWIARRLRTATELDCDRRVVRRGADTRRYAHLLLLIAQRQGQATFASMIAGSPSTLHERIAAMHSTRPARPVLRVAALLLVALIAGAAAASPAMARELASVYGRVRQTSLPAVKAPTSRRHVTSVPGVFLPTVVTTATRPSTPGRPAVSNALPPVIEPAPAVKQDTTKKTMFEFKLDSQVVFAPGSPAPRYPDALRSSGTNGVTVVQIVVDTTGLPMASSFKVVRSANELFTQAVKTALLGAHFIPARVGERRVRQLVQVFYRFRVEGTVLTDTLGAPSGIRSLEVTITVPR